MTATLEERPAARLPVEDLGGQAKAAPTPGRVIATVFAGLFFAAGFLVGGGLEAAARQPAQPEPSRA